MRKSKKIFCLFIIFNFLTALIYLNYFEINAADEDSSFIKQMEDQASEFISTGKDAASGQAGEVADSVVGNFADLGKLLTLFGAGVMIAVVSYMGIKYMMAPPDKQAALKQQLVGVVVAGIVIFGAYGIWKTAISIFSTFD